MEVPLSEPRLWRRKGSRGCLGGVGEVECFDEIVRREEIGAIQKDLSWRSLWDHNMHKLQSKLSS